MATNERNWDEYLDTRRTNAYTDKPFILPFLKGNLLEIGCGYGDFGAWCKEQGTCQQVTGIDPSGAAIKQAQEQYPNCQWLEAGAEQLPFADASFDSIVSLEVLEHIKQPELMIKEATRVLKPGGSLVIQTPNYPTKRLYDAMYWLRGHRPDMKDDPTHVSPITLGRMQKLLKAQGLEIMHLVGRNILGESRVSSLAHFKRTRFGRLFSQKMIAIARKP